MRVLLFPAIFVLYLLRIGWCDDKYLNPEWKAPHAWGNHREATNEGNHREATNEAPKEECRIADSELRECTDSRIALNKLVTFLFDRDNYGVEEADGFYHRTIHLHVTEGQLQKLAKLSKSNDLDSLISEILVQSEFGTLHAINELVVDVFSTWKRHLALNFGGVDWAQLQQDIPSITFDNVLKLVVFVAAYFVCRRYNISFLFVILGTVLYYLYLHLDFECRKKAAVEETLQFMYGDTNPCRNGQNSWWDYLLGNDDRSKCKEYLLRKQSNPNQCGVVDLFKEFISIFVFDVMNAFFINLGDLIKSINMVHGIAITAILLFFMKDILSTLIHSIFKYVLNPSVWARVIQANRPAEPTTDPLPATIPIAPGANVRDEHLTMALELASRQVTIVETLSNHFVQPNAMHAQVRTSCVEMLPIGNDSASAEATSIEEVAAYEDVMCPDGKLLAEPNDGTGLEQSATEFESSIDTLETESMDVVDRTRLETESAHSLLFRIKDEYL